MMCCVFINTLFSVALAGPEGAQVINGQVSIQQSGYNTTITASDKSIINYSSFDIARPEIVEFIQPSSNASVLNRIHSANPTNINGTLLANGRVFFVNPAGVYIGEGARVNVNQLVASGLNITNSDFINGRYNFEGGNGSVINEGDITAEKVYLIGKEVVNSGSIHCPGGYVIMAAGDRVFLNEPDSEIMVEIDPQASSDAANFTDSEPGVPNKDEVGTSGSRIVLGAGDIHTQAISNVGSLAASIEINGAGKISNTGTIEAKSENETGGTVIAKAAEVVNSGTVDVTGSEGGNVEIEATDRLGQFGTIHAYGTVSHGGSVGLTASDVVALSSDSVTTANAGTNGRGGEVIVYSPDTALFHEGAKIEAKGGSESGDGGFIEVSGKKHVEVFGQANASAPSGKAGKFLIDPTDVTISDATVDMDNGPSWNPTTPDQTTGTIDAAAIEGSLQNGTDVSVDTFDDGSGSGTGRIIVNSAIDVDLTTTGGSAIESPTLTLNPEDDIEINAQIGVTATDNAADLLNLNLNATNGVDINASISTDGGALTSTGTTFDNTEGTITTNGGNISIQNTGNVTIGAETNAGEGDVDIGGGVGVARNIISSGGIIKSSGTITLVASGNIGVPGEAIDIASTGTINASSTVAGDVILYSAGDITTKTLSTITGDISVESTFGDLILDGPVTSGGGITLRSFFGNIEAKALTATGDIYVESWADLILNGPATARGAIELISTGENTKAQELKETGDILVGSPKGLILNGQVTSGGGITLRNFFGNIEAQMLVTSGNIDVWASFSDLILNGPVSSRGGGVKLTARKIYTKGADDTLNITITGYSDVTKGVGLPGATSDYPGKAAIVIRSQDDLKLGPSAVLTAKGNYHAGIDDRQGVEFKGSGEDCGDPIDVAIYIDAYGYDITLELDLAREPLSKSGAFNIDQIVTARPSFVVNFSDVTIDSPFEIYPGGTMVINAVNRVNDFGDNFKNFWTFNAGRNRLEVCSRKTRTLEESIAYKTLPHAEEAREGMAPPWFRGSKYVLRGSSEGKVLCMVEPAPLTVAKPPDLEFHDEVEAPNMEEILQFLDKLGIGYQPLLAAAYPETLSTDIRLYDMAEKITYLEKTLKDSKRIAVLVPLIQGIRETHAATEEKMALFVQELNHKESAGQWVNALTECVAMLRLEAGQEFEASMINAMRLYGRQLGGEENELFIEEYIAELFSDNISPI